MGEGNTGQRSVDWYIEAVKEHGEWIRESPRSEREIAARVGAGRVVARKVRDLARRAGLGQQLTEKVDGEDRLLTAKGYRVKTLADLLAEAEVDLSVWEVADYAANVWEQHSSAHGLVPLHQVKAKLVRRATPLRPAQPVEYTPPEAPNPVRRDATLVLIVPDTQHGARWLDPRLRRAVTTHDQKAFETFLAVAAHLQPDVIEFLGDDIDAAEASKYANDWTTRGTMQMTIDMWAYNLARVRAACPYARIVIHEGNHDKRVRDRVADALPWLDGLRPAGEDEALVSLHRLLHLDKLGVDLAQPYGADESWHGDFDPVCLKHAGKLRSDGPSSAKATLAAAEEHTVVGHEHRRWIATKTVWRHGEPWEVTACSPGALVRRGGIVPGVTAREDWQQGLALAWVEEGHPTTVEILPFDLQGRCRYQGLTYEGPDGLEGLAEATGWAQLLVQ